MRPFDHVLIAGMEFMLWYKNDSAPFFEQKGVEWYALDSEKRKVGISDHNVLTMAYGCTSLNFLGNVWLTTSGTNSR